MIRIRKAALASMAALCAILFTVARIQAQTDAAQSGDTLQSFSTQNAPVVRMQMRSGTVFIRTWDRPQVQIESNAPVQARYIPAAIVGRAVRSGDVPVFSTKVLSAAGPLTLPTEDFPVPALTSGEHDGVVVFGGDDGARITLTVPSGSAFLWVMVGRGGIHLQDYRAGAFLARVHAGVLTLRDVGGDGYAEVARGRIAIQDSAFNRLRARTAIGNILFTNCNARQIEVSSVNGSIAYDGGTFVPGVASFATQNGDVALGVAGGGVEVDAHSGSARIFSAISNAPIPGANASRARLAVNGGGPVVTVNAERGAVYLYDGSLRSQPALRRAWRPLNKMMKAPTIKTSARPRRPI